MYALTLVLVTLKMVGSSKNTKNAIAFDPTKLSDESRYIIDQIKIQFTELSNSFKSLSIKFDTVITKKDEEIRELKEVTCDLKKRILKLENTLDEEDAYIRRDSLLFSGNAIPNATNGEICKNIVKRVVFEKLNIEISDADISVAHRVGTKPPSQQPDRRQIIAKFCRRDVKRDLLIAKRSFSARFDRNSSLFINESLTPRRRAIFYAARQMKKAHPSIISGCSTLEGKICIYTRNPSDLSRPGEQLRSKRHIINSRESLQVFCDEYIKAPLERFLGSWEF